MEEKMILLEDFYNTDFKSDIFALSLLDKFNVDKFLIEGMELEFHQAAKVAKLTEDEKEYLAEGISKHSIENANLILDSSNDKIVKAISLSYGNINKYKYIEALENMIHDISLVCPHNLEIMAAKEIIDTLRSHEVLYTKAFRSNNIVKKTAYTSSLIIATYTIIKEHITYLDKTKSMNEEKLCMKEPVGDVVSDKHNLALLKVNLALVKNKDNEIKAMNHQLRESTEEDILRNRLFGESEEILSENLGRFKRAALSAAFVGGGAATIGATTSYKKGSDLYNQQKSEALSNLSKAQADVATQQQAVDAAQEALNNVSKMTLHDFIPADYKPEGVINQLAHMVIGNIPEEVKAKAETALKFAQSSAQAKYDAAVSTLNAAKSKADELAKMVSDSKFAAAGEIASDEASKISVGVGHYLKNPGEFIPDTTELFSSFMKGVTNFLDNVFTSPWTYMACLAIGATFGRRIVKKASFKMVEYIESYEVVQESYKSSKFKSERLIGKFIDLGVKFKRLVLSFYVDSKSATIKDYVAELKKDVSIIQKSEPKAMEAKSLNANSSFF